VNIGRGGLGLGAIVAIVSACTKPAPQTETVARPPAVPQLQIAPPVERTTIIVEPPLLAPVDSAREERVQIDTHGREVDVREILTFLGRRAGLQFVFSPETNRKVRLTLVDVPLSQAIQTVLSVARLTLEPTNTDAQRVTSGAVVFYTLPVNVDSLTSVDAIVKRFGVGREIARLILDSRTRRP
jgi:hypothetical protein